MSNHRIHRTAHAQTSSDAVPCRAEASALPAAASPGQYPACSSRAPRNTPFS
eukprot:CAMPEP_0113667478 /NCGR_PEP_ID=MMETSP0038_2-20120614/3459_1 /TAXON_ID=2898 /ORGANISM="Cryptomonas paramecium" /LENGTH=51 /DNA_ID=CAMNT_0000583099 /DNA_START=310 /DNA_END=462 /DNA_ORIENTATION=- /assembly_acc=CAM_ASM_000170